MPLVRIQKNFQVTIPAAIRKQIQLVEGDLLEATTSKNGILLKPKVVIDREKIADNIEKIFAEINAKQTSQKTDAQIMEEAIKFIKDTRQETKAE